jgi:type I restriction enzyme M protein
MLDALRGSYSTLNYAEIIAAVLFLEKTYRKYSSEDKTKIEYYEKFMNNEKPQFNIVENKIADDIFSLGILEGDDEIIKEALEILTEVEIADLYKILEKLLEKEEHHTTINSISKLAIDLLNIEEKDRVVDLCSGYGLFLKELNKKNYNVQTTGIEINSSVAATSRIMQYLLNKETNIINADVLKYEVKGKYNKVFSEFPFNMRLNKETIKEYRDRYPIRLPSSSGDSIFTLKILEFLEENGKAFILTTNGYLFRSQNKDLRKYLLEKKYIESIIQLPDRLLKNTGIPISIVILSKKDNNKIKMIDASRIYTQGKRNKILTDENIREILDIYKKEEHEVGLEEIIEKEYTLLPKRYAKNIEFENSIKINEISEEIFRGVQIPSKKLNEMQTHDEDYDYEVLNVGDIDEFKINYDNLLKIQSTNKKYDKYLVKDKDFIMTIRGTTFKSAVVEIEDERKIIATGNIMVLRLDTNKVNPYYLKTFLDSKIGRKLLYSIETGSSLISISKKTLTNAEIPLLDLEDQKEIGNKFLAYQDELKYYQKKEKDIKDKLNTIYEDETGGA